MPYKSDAERRFFHTPAAKEAGISEKTVAEFDKASKGKELPEKASKPRKKQDVMTKIKEAKARLKMK